MFVLLYPPSLILWQREIGEGKNSNKEQWWHSWLVRGLRCVRSRIQSIPSDISNPCSSFSPFSVAGLSTLPDNPGDSRTLNCFSQSPD